VSRGMPVQGGPRIRTRTLEPKSAIMRKRSKILVDYPVQGSIVRQLICHWFVACGVIFIYLLCMQVFKGGVQKPVNVHLSEMWSQYGILLVVLATVFPVFVFDAIRLSHRFTGPMIPFGRALQRLSEGQAIEPVNFRQTDFWKHLSRDLNSVAQKLNLMSENPVGEKSR
jgi:hypothetical protein